MTSALRSRLLDRISVAGGDQCWMWVTAEKGEGHIQIRIGESKQYVHRVIYEWLHGPIPEDHGLHHTCETPRCVNPKHLLPVDHAAHQLEHDYKGIKIRAEKARAKTHCINGHAYTKDNTRITKEGWRRCRTCERASQRHEALK